MTLIKCKKCNKQISNKINVCPHCGLITKSYKLIFLILLSLILTILNFVHSNIILILLIIALLTKIMELGGNYHINKLSYINIFIIWVLMFLNLLNLSLFSMRLIATNISIYDILASTTITGALCFLYYINDIAKKENKNFKNK